MVFVVKNITAVRTTPRWSQNKKLKILTIFYFLIKNRNVMTKIVNSVMTFFIYNRTERSFEI